MGKPKGSKSRISEFEAAIINRLDALIGLSIEPVTEKGLYPRARRLRDAGLKHGEIAKILGKTENHVKKELSVGGKKEPGDTDGK